MNSNKKFNIWKLLTSKLFLIGLTVIVVSAGFLTVGYDFYQDSDTKDLSFKDIGELATQSITATQVNVTDKSRDFFGMFDIPFTQTKYIYSYDVEIKAGYNFEEIVPDVNHTSKTVTIHLPEAEILSSELDEDSFKVYHESESIFTNVTLEENNKAVEKMKEDAQESAIKSGLLDEARENAETILTNFVDSFYGKGEYEIKFEG